MGSLWGLNGKMCTKHYYIRPHTSVKVSPGNKFSSSDSRAWTPSHWLLNSMFKWLRYSLYLLFFHRWIHENISLLPFTVNHFFTHNHLPLLPPQHNSHSLGKWQLTTVINNAPLGCNIQTLFISCFSNSADWFRVSRVALLHAFI